MVCIIIHVFYIDEAPKTCQVFLDENGLELFLEVLKVSKLPLQTRLHMAKYKYKYKYSYLFQLFVCKKYKIQYIQYNYIIVCLLFVHA